MADLLRWVRVLCATRHSALTMAAMSIARTAGTRTTVRRQDTAAGGAAHDQLLGPE